MPRPPRPSSVLSAAFHGWRGALLLALAVALALRAALPVALRQLLVTRGSAALGAELVVGDVDLWLLRGALALEDAALFAERPGLRAPGAERPAPPLLGWKRVFVNWSWLALARRTLVLQEASLDGPVVNLERGPDGRLNLERLIPAPSDAERAEAGQAVEEQVASPWSYAVARLGVRSGRITFRDLSVGSGATLEGELDSVDVANLVWGAGAPGQAGTLRLETRVAGAPLQVEGDVTLAPGAPALHARIEARDLPLSRIDAWTGALGGMRSTGRLDASLEYRLAGAQEHRLSGRLALRELALDVIGVEGTPLRWRDLRVDALDLDLVRRSLHAGSVYLAGAALRVEPAADPVLPLLRATSSRPFAAPEAPAPPADAPAPAAPAWSWSVARLELADARVDLAGPAGDWGLGLRGVARELRSRGGPDSEVELQVQDGSFAATARGSLRLEPLSLRGELRWQQLPLPRVASFLAAEAAGWIRAGHSSGDLSVDLGEASEAPPGALRLAGRTNLAKLDLAAPDADLFALSWDELQADLAELLVPGLLPGGPGSPGPPRVRIEALRLREPSARLTRTEQGFVLPPAPPSDADAEPEAARAAPDVRLASFAASGGQLVLVDRSIEPEFRGLFAGVELQASGLRVTPLQVPSLELRGTAFESGGWSVSGGYQPRQSRFEARVERLALLPFDPYLRSAVGLGVRRGAASLRSRVELTGERFESSNSLVLHELDLAGERGAQAFLDTFGISLALAMALLRDPGGDIALELPLAGDVGGARVGLTGTLLGALRQALLGALTTPLKLLGSVVVGGDRIEGFAPDPIAFPAGRDEPTPPGREQLGRLTSLLGPRSALQVTLTGVAVEADRRALQERALLDALRGGAEPDVGAEEARALGDFLEARAAGRPVLLSEEQTARLEALLAARPLAPEALAALADARARNAARILRENHGAREDRLRLGAAQAEPASGEPRVELQIEPAPS